MVAVSIGQMNTGGCVLRGAIVVHKIVEKVPDKVLQQDLEKYRQRALGPGATDAKIITTDIVVIDDRVRLKLIWYVLN